MKNARQTEILNIIQNADVETQEQLLMHLKERGFRRRTVGLMENGSWAPMAVKIMTGMLAECQNLTFAENNVKLLSSLSEESKAQIEALAKELY